MCFLLIRFDYNIRQKYKITKNMDDINNFKALQIQSRKINCYY